MIFYLGACGRATGQIVGGSAVTPYSLPWQVALVRPGRVRPFCGGTLISDRHVLTAAHCVKPGKKFDIIVGEHDYTSSSDGTRHKVCRESSHPNFSKKTMNADFAMVHLEVPVQTGKRATPACLAKESWGGDFLAGKTMTVSG